MKGGYQILILSAITLVEDTETTITDLNILDQLLGLTDFLNKDGKIDKQLKPILIITKDSAGFVSITNNDTNKLLIDGYISGKHIQLNITYTSSLDDYGNTVYAISSAKYIYAAVSGGTKLFKHQISIADSAIVIINNNDELLNTQLKILDALDDFSAISCYTISANYGAGPMLAWSGTAGFLWFDFYDADEEQIMRDEWDLEGQTIIDTVTPL